MKRTKVLILMVLGLAFSTSTFAQNGRFSLGAELALPMGDFADFSSIGFGGSLRYEYPVSDNIGLTGTVGYLIFGGKAEGDFDGIDYSMIPIQIGGKYYFTENQNGMYFGVEVGVHSLKAEYTEDFGGSEISVSTTSTELSYAPALGYHLANVDIGLRYQMIATEGESTSYLGIRLAYVFGEQ